VRTIGTATTTVYEQKQEVAATRSYSSEEIGFVLPIPRDATDRRAPAPPPGTLGDVARAVSSVVSPSSGPLQWRLSVSLVIPWGRDLEHAVDIVVD
jgi:hypothetical protein